MNSLSLLHPANGSATHPLQSFTWSGHLDLENPGPFDRSSPRPVKLTWKRPSRNIKPLRYDLILSLDPGFGETLKITDLRKPSAEIWNLYLGKRYFWKVIARNGGHGDTESPTWSFVTSPVRPRWLRVPEITNMRDIGGWPLKAGGTLRQGMFYRSSEMNSHLSLTEEGRRILLEDLKIKTDIDLRGSEELRGPALDEKRVRWINIPIQPYDNIALPEYRPLYRMAFQVLADPASYPAIVHCWGGADRTGTLVFLLEAILGVEEASLVQDYELTSLSIWGNRSSSSPEFERFLETLACFAKPGSSLQEQAQGYLQNIGVTEGEITSMRVLLTE